MSDEYLNVLNTSRTFKLRAEIMALMLKGAGYAAAVLVGAGLFIYVLYLLGLALPPESKEAVDPNVVYLLEAPAGPTVT